jgi:hypothetical protein
MLLYHDFRLMHEDVAEETIRASVDGGLVPHSYTPATHIVHLEQAGTFGSLVEIDYCEQGS